MENFIDDKHLPAMTTLKKLIANIQYPEMTLDQTSCILEQFHNDKNLKAHSEEFDQCIQPDHELVTSPDFERGLSHRLNSPGCLFQ